MGGFLKFLLGLLVLVLLAALIVPAFLAPGWSIERSAVVGAPPERVYPLVARLPAWEKWVSWSVNPDARATFRYEGPEEGVGAVMHWEGQAGAGTVRIVQADPPRALECEIELRGGAARSRSRFEFVATDGGTRVTWKDEGRFGDEGLGGYFARLGGPLMESGFGQAIEDGLENLQVLAKGAG